MAKPEMLELPAGLTPIGRALIADAIEVAAHNAKLTASALARGVQGGGPTGFMISPTYDRGGFVRG